MKFLKLTVKNIASIEEAELDFQKKPLSNARLFLMSGNTGSGKSTLLDAICLALYKKTPRLEQADSMKLDFGKDFITARDPRNLMRHGSTESSATLIFEGNDGNVYEACWLTKRTRNKTLSKDERILRVLDGTDSNYVDGKCIEQKIEEVVGLGFDEFCRTTMLAQGQFTQFLKSKEKDKSAILEKITNTTQYSAIGKTIYDLYKAVEKDFELEKAKLQSIQRLSEEELEEKREQLRECEVLIRNMTVQRNQTNNKIQWLETDQKNAKAVKVEEEKFDELKKQMEDPLFRADEKMIEEWDISVDARMALKGRDDCEKSFRNITEVQEPEAQREYALLVAAKSACEEMQNSAKQILLDKNGALKEEKIYAAMYGKAQGITTKLEEIFNDKQQNIKEEQEVLTLEQFLPQLNKAVEDAEKSYKTAKLAVEEKKADIEKVTSELQKLNPKELLQKRENLSERQGTLNVVRKSLNALELSQNEEKTKECNVREVQLSIENAKKELADHAALLKQYEEAAKLANNLLKSATLAVGDVVKSLRTQLKDGDNCPICGHKIEKLVTDEEVAKSLAPLKKDFEEKEQLLKSMQVQMATWNKVVKDGEPKLINFQKELANTRQNVSKLLEKVKTACADLSITFTDVLDGNLQLDLLQQNIEAENRKLGEIQQRVDAKNEQIRNLNNELSELQNGRDSNEAKLEKAKGVVANQQSMIEEKKRNMQCRAKEIDNSIEMLNDIITIPDWQEKWVADEKRFNSDLLTRASAYADLTDDIRNLNAKLDKYAQDLKNVEASYQRVAAQWSEWQPCLVEGSAFSEEELVSRWNTFANNADKLYIKKEDCLQKKEACNSALLEFYKKCPAIDEERLKTLTEATDVETLRKNHQLVKDNYNATLGSLNSLNLIYENHHATAHEEIGEADTVETLRQSFDAEGESLNAFNQQKGGLEKEIEKDETARKQCEQQLNVVNALELKMRRWSTLNDHFGGSDGMKFRNIAQSYLLENLLRSANLYLRNMSGRYMLECVPNTLIISLRDQYQPEMVSPVDTLSGGESFIVSLSLALALASMNRHGLSVDTLFIDEGFGTLSENELGTVMNLLENLQKSNGKRVGIISHVKELRERIPVHVEVERIDPTRSGVRVVDVTA